MSTNDQLVCLLDSGLTTDYDYFEYTNFIDVISDSSNVRDRVCNIPRPTPSPTHQPHLVHHQIQHHTLHHYQHHNQQQLQ